MQVWFQNRRARYRKQERTGSVSMRSRYRQRRVQKALQQTQPPMPMYPGLMPPLAGRSSTVMLPSPQAVSQYMTNFPFPGQFPTTTSASPNNPELAVPAPFATPSPNYLPGFHTFRPSIPLVGPVAQNMHS